ncbi:dihydrodipicolinate synthase family protein [Breznakiella homolactica]|uniref:Dihydrodipicolinate synthase family protein n=1 Tax=Breznakiella homolactica TaxID=2798577 RepID=A0A7T7XKC7_9SPIR|nr:dihydrodipicolinate synthase family protein [Breznakiella homolactica]QQO07900.1 dihydrodipicolinate synthase family protein [Breznakiella homolactica]
MNLNFPDGIWPVMLTPFTEEGSVDFAKLEELIEWYQANGSAGLFAVCQSSEMFFLSQDERAAVAKFVKEHARIPVIASGHISDGMDEQTEELNRIAASGVDALILISNRLAAPEEGDAVFLERLERLMERLPPDLPLGVYECPYPYKRLLSPAVVRYMAGSGRFHFIKDTSCDMDNIREKLEITKGSGLKLYNANTATLLESLRAGASGYSGVMANFHPRLYRLLLGHWEAAPREAEVLQELLTMCSLIECRSYPRNAKYMLQLLGLGLTQYTRKPDMPPLSAAERAEVQQLAGLSEAVENRLAEAGW